MQASDGTNTSTVTVALTESNLNDNTPAFGAGSYSFTYAENQTAGAVLGTVSASDADLADTVTYSITGGDPNGWFQINAAGEISLTTAGAASLANDYEVLANTRNLTVQASDGTNTSTVTVALTEMPVSDLAPVAVNDSYTVSEGGVLTGHNLISENDTDGDVPADTLTLASVNGVAWASLAASTDSTYTAALGYKQVATSNGTAYLKADGTVVYAHNGSETTGDAFTYTVSDGTNVSNPATVSYTVTPVNDNPVASGGQVYGAEDTNYVFSWANFNVSDVDTPVASLGVKISTLPADGVLQISSNGTSWTDVIAGQLISKTTIDNGRLRFVPDTNESGADVFGGIGTGNRQADYASFTYTPNDGSVDGVAAAMRLDIAPVADAPNLSFGALVYTVTNITATNATTTTNGFNMLAYNANGSAGAISLRASGSPTGFGVAGTASGDDTELGYLSGTGSEKLVVNFDNLVSSVDVSFAWLAGGERYTVQFLNAGTVVGGYTSTTGGSDGVDPLITLMPGNGAQFNQIVFSAPSSPGDSDYLINKIAFNRVTSSNPSIATSDDGIVNLGLSSSLNDADGSETLKVVISGIPSGFSLTDGTHTFNAAGTPGSTSSVDVTGWSLSAIQLIVPDNVQGTAHLTATATATESSNLDFASVSKTVDVVITHAQTSAADTVITNTALGTAFTVPLSAFLYNDVGGADSITAISSASGLTATTSGSNISITDATPAGGSFNYTASTSVFDLDTNSTVVKTSTGTVVVSRDASGAMDGTTADNILVDTLTSNTTMNSDAGNDVLVSNAASGADTLDGGDGNDLLIGGAGSDSLTGGLGADTFAWRLADKGASGSAATTASDTIYGFDTAANSDRLDLRDLLVGENHASGVGNLANYIDITTSGGDTVIRVSSTGGFTGGTYGAGAEDQRITLSGANLYSAYGITAGDDAALIQKLLTDGKLKVD